MASLFGYLPRDGPTQIRSDVIADRPRLSKIRTPMIKNIVREYESNVVDLISSVNICRAKIKTRKRSRTSDENVSVIRIRLFKQSFDNGKVRFIGGDNLYIKRQKRSRSGFSKHWMQNQQRLRSHSFHRNSNRIRCSPPWLQAMTRCAQYQRTADHQCRRHPHWKLRDRSLPIQSLHTESTPELVWVRGIYIQTMCWIASSSCGPFAGMMMFSDC